MHDTSHAASGLFGISSGTIANISVSGSIDGRGGPTTSYVGGIVGQNNGLVRDSHSSATVYGYYAGGLSGGSATGTATIERSTASGTVYALDGSPYAGGLAGTAYSVIDSSASGNVISTVSNSYVGGLVGYMTGDISRSSASGNVTASGNNVKAGGLVGFSTGAITDSIATGAVTAGTKAVAGGLVGQASGAMTNVRASGDVVGGDGATVGGLAGSNYGAVTKAIAIGDATAGVGGVAGGLVGKNAAGISVSYSTGAASASGSADTMGYAGGLVGDNEASVSQAYSTGAATGLVNTYIGGLIGKWGAGTVSDTYATGLVTGQTGQIGGFAGVRVGSPGSSDNYFDTMTTGTATSIGKIDQYTSLIGLMGLTTEQFARGQATLSGGWVSGAPYKVLSALPYIVVTGTDAHQTYGSSSVIAPKTVTAVASDGIDTTSSLAGIGPWHGYGNQAAGNAYATWASGVSSPWHQVTYNANLYVDPASLTIFAGSGSSVYGQSVSTPSYTVSGLLNGDTVSSVNVANTASSASSVGHYAVNASGAAGSGLSNYDVKYVAGDWSITPATLTAKANDGSTVYGHAAGGYGFTASGLMNNDTITSVTLSTPATSKSSVGQYAINASNAVGTGLGNYVIDYKTGTLTITPAPLTVTAGSGSSVYGATPTSAGYSVAGLVNGDTVSGVSVNQPVTGTSGVGAYVTTASNAVGTGLGNYEIDYENGSWNVTPAMLTIAANDAASTYGRTPKTAGFTVNGLVNEDAVSGVDLNTGAAAASSIGNYAIGVSGATGSGLSNYDITYRPGTLTIDPAVLTVTALNQSSTYGQNPSLGTAGFSASGLVNGDTISGVRLTTDATSASGVGRYGIVASDASGKGLGNYSISYQNGTLTVDPAVLTVIAGNGTSVYGQQAELPGWTVNGLVNGDRVTSVNVDVGHTVASGVGTYTTTASGATGTGLSNYTIAYQNGSWTVTPATVVVKPDDQKSEYGKTPLSQNPGVIATAAVNPVVKSGVMAVSCNASGNLVGETEMTCQTRGK